MPREFEFIDWIRSQPVGREDVIIPPGDDLAALRWGDDLLLAGVDQVIDGVHVDSTQHAWEAIGAKAMNRNLSDCAAMGCLPVAAVVTAALPRGFSLEAAKQIDRGLRQAGAAFGCVIVGGDTASHDGKLLLTLTILAKSGGVDPIRRQGAKPGDRIYVTGALGGSLLGRHLTFVPRVREGRMLAERKLAGAMIDLSDGLSRDLRHLCEASGVGAIVDADAVPIHADARLRASQTGRDALEHALHDGEDYELLFTSSQPIDPAWPCIGRIVGGADVMIEHNGRATPLLPLGWEHA